MAPAHSRVDATFMVASLPHGYIYRLESQRHVALGLVGRGQLLTMDANQIRGHVERSGAGWILDSFPTLEQIVPGKTALASVQWTAGGHALRLGDAALARDVLSSQGLSCGMSEALYAAAVRTPADERMFNIRQARERLRHLHTLSDLIGRCRYRRVSTWNEYAAFVNLHSSDYGSNPRIALRNNRLQKVAQ
jgi:hypothetical protein